MAYQDRRYHAAGQDQGAPYAWRSTATEAADIIDTTVGRIIFNQPIPQDLGYVDRTIPENCSCLEVDFLVDKKQLGQIIDRCIQVTRHRPSPAEMLDEIKAQGYKYSTQGRGHRSRFGRRDPAPEEAELLAAAEEQIGKIDQAVQQGPDLQRGAL